MSVALTSLATVDNRPFFDKAIHYGVKQEIIAPDRVQSIQDDLSKGIVQIANYFGTAYLRPELELALHRMVNLISLYLEDMSGGDLKIAAVSLRDKTLLAHSKAGSDMIKRLHAMPDSTLIMGGMVSAESQRALIDEMTDSEIMGGTDLAAIQRALLDKQRAFLDKQRAFLDEQRAFLNEMTASDTSPLAKYQSEFAIRLEKQNTIEFAFWLAKKMGVSRDEIQDADLLIRSAMLVIYVDQAELIIPTRTALVRLIKAAKQGKNKFNESRLTGLIKEAPTEFQSLAREAMAQFIEKELPQIRESSRTADKFPHGEISKMYFARASLNDDSREYDRLVAKEWDRVTRGEADDPAVVATVLLLVATGLPPQASMLKRVGKEVIKHFRTHGFDSQAVIKFIDEHAPVSYLEDLLRFWMEDLKPDAEEQLDDTDPNWPDSHMERALEYLRKTCSVSWKARKR